MAWQLPPVFFLYLLVCLAMAAIGFTGYRHRDIAGSRPLTLTALSVAGWTGLETVSIAATGYTVIIAVANLAYLPIAFLPVVLVWFAEAYTGHDTPLTRYGFAPLLVMPALTQVFVWTNPAHNLFYTERALDYATPFVTTASEWGPLFWVHSAYSYALLLTASYYLLRTLIVSEDVYSGQAAAILLGVLAPWVSNALYLGGLIQFPTDPTPIAFSVTVLAFVVAIYRHRLLQLVPVARELARDELMDSLGEGVLILDEQDRVVDCNERALALVEDRDAVVGHTLASVAPDIASKLDGLETTADGEPVGAEVAIRRDGRLRHYDVRVTRLRRGHGVLTGRLVSLREVTERRQREQRLDVLNRTLRHDLRNEANVVIGYAELGQRQHPDAEWVEAIRTHVSGLVDMSEKVRQIEQAFDEEQVEPTTVDAVDVVGAVVDSIENDHPDLDITSHTPATAPVHAIELVDAAIRNAVENAVEHNDNPDPLMDVAVRVTREDDTVAISVSDNGPGIHEDEQAVLLRGRETQLDHVSGLGLWLIHWIVTRSGGEIEITENDPRGTVLTIRLPAGGEDTRGREADTEVADGAAAAVGGAAEGWAGAPDDSGSERGAGRSNATPDGGSS
jgi:PAS domain S-box-containing protein